MQTFWGVAATRGYSAREDAVQYVYVLKLNMLFVYNYILRLIIANYVPLK